MEYARKSRMKKVLNAKDQDQPRTLSPILADVRSYSQTTMHINQIVNQNQMQTYSKTMQIILQKKPQRLLEVQQYLSPGSPQLKSSDKEQPLTGELTSQINRSKTETRMNCIQVERNKNSPQIKLKSKLYERRGKKLE